MNSVPHIVVAKLPNVPVYRLKPEGGTGREKTLHRDHLLPIGQSVRFPHVNVKEKSSRKPVTRSDREVRRSVFFSGRPVDLPNSSSSSESEMCYSYVDGRHKILDLPRREPDPICGDTAEPEDDVSSVQEQSDVG